MIKSENSPNWNWLTCWRRWISVLLVLYSILRVYIYKYMWEHNQTQYTNFNEQTNTLLYENISLTLFSKERCCVWERSWRQGQTAILTQVLLMTIAALLPHLGWDCSTVGHWGPKALCLPLALTSASCPNWLEPSVHLVILLFNADLLLLFFRLFTQVHLLIDGSVEGLEIHHDIWTQIWLVSTKLELLFLVSRCISLSAVKNLIVLLYTLKSVSFQFCLYIFFVRKKK